MQNEKLSRKLWKFVFDLAQVFVMITFSLADLKSWLLTLMSGIQRDSIGTSEIDLCKGKINTQVIVEKIRFVIQPLCCGIDNNNYFACK